MSAAYSFLSKASLTSKQHKLLAATRCIELVQNLPERISSYELHKVYGRYITIVADENTYAALGQKLEVALSEQAQVSIIIFPNGVKPTAKNADRVWRECSFADVIFAVGSGTINDICKRAAAMENTPYAIAATAPSMNGYLSANASIIVEGYKKSIPAQLPVAAFFDLDVLAEAPMRLLQSGLGDSLCRPTAQADWLLSHSLLDTEYSELPFSLTAPYEKELFDNSSKLLQRDRRYIELLTRTLIASGLGMTIAGGSYPASQGEHMIAHTYEMLIHPNESGLFHGEEIAITTPYMAELQEKILGLPYPPQLSHITFDQAVMTQLYGRKKAEEALGQWQEKCAKVEVDVLNQKLKESWPELAKRIKEIHLSSAYLKTVLQNAGINREWDGGVFKQASATARFTRNRFTFLDV